MKSNAQPFYFSPYVAKGPNQEPAAKASHQSPYLRAVLNGKTRVADNARASLMADSSMTAALRYIAHTR